MTRTWRLLMTEPTDGATNMAIDEALWRARQAATSPPTLRFYAWAPPAVSLGYGQTPGDDVSLEACRRFGVGIVRRPTGGSAIYHDGSERELTYSVAASTDDLGGARDMLHSYAWIGAALLRGLRDLGAPVEMTRAAVSDATPAFCFARTGRCEIEIAGKKLVGSAQRRRRGYFLQHGSVVLGVDAPRLRALFPTTADPAATMATLEAALGRRPDWDECAAALAAGFEAEHALDLRPGGLTEDEMIDTERLVKDKYATDAWLAGAA